MAIKLTLNAIEESTYGITIDFYDDAGAAVSPATMTWTLSDKDGTVINARQDVAISNPTSSETITLSGDDLAVSEGESSLRILTLEGTYDSGTLGTGLAFRDSCQFVVEDLAAVT